MRTLFALFVVAFVGSANAQILQEQDKKLHFAAGVITSSLGYQLVYSKTQNKEQALAAGILTSIAAGIGKEIYDSLQKKNHFDQHDVAATVLGGVSFSLVIKLDAINFGSEAKRKKKKRKKQKK